MTESTKWRPIAHLCWRFEDAKEIIRVLIQCFAEGTDSLFSMNIPADESKKLCPVAHMRWRLVDAETIV
jgi:hypothetical protein